MTRTRLSRTTPATARTRPHAGAGLLLAGALLTGCGAQPGEIPLSEIRAESPSPTPTVEAAIANGTAAAVVDAAAATPTAPPAHNGLIAGRAFLDQDRLTSAIFAVTADGRTRQQLTQPADLTRDDHPTWSPDGTALAFDRTGGDSPAASGPRAPTAGTPVSSARSARPAPRTASTRRRPRPPGPPTAN